MEALSALPKFCSSWHLQKAAAAIPSGADVRLRLVKSNVRLILRQNPVLKKKSLNVFFLEYVICQNVPKLYSSSNGSSFISSYLCIQTKQKSGMSTCGYLKLWAQGKIYMNQPQACYAACTCRQYSKRPRHLHYSNFVPLPWSETTRNMPCTCQWGIINKQGLF